MRDIVPMLVLFFGCVIWPAVTFLLGLWSGYKNRGAAVGKTTPAEKTIRPAGDKFAIEE